MQTLEVRHFRSVACFGQGFEAGFNQLNRTTAQNRLLTEQIGFGFVLEGGFDDTGTAAADAAGVGQSYILALPDASWKIAIRSGIPPPLVNSVRTVWPGAFGATMITSRSLRGTIWL